ncbi:FAD binding domain-containing protein [Brevibacterium permense]|uniref:Xanthine dehydrogenase family protein subunit M n=1 Tax=Brevibacterium permense TaxID=234834 RepID=A0ABN2A3Q0_9MICO
MKAAPFAYVRPTRLQDAVTELGSAQHGGGKVIAGGQSLVPVLAMRLGRPSTLVDITRVEELTHMTVDDQCLRVAAAVRQRRVQREASQLVPLLGLALPWVGHREIRSRGTVCGSLAHADPSAEMPAVAMSLNATVEVTGPNGRRQVSAADFFTGAMATVTEPTEIVTSVSFPIASSDEGYGFAEIARRHGDYAIAGVAARVRSTSGAVVEAPITSFGVSDKPQLRDMSGALQRAVDSLGDPAAPTSEITNALEEPAHAMAEDVVTTAGDSHGSTAYRKRLVRVLAARELARAYRSSLKGA